MASKRQEFYMSVKAILDKAQAKKDAAELQELLSQTKIDFDTPEFESKVRAVVQKMSKETMSVIGQSFNEALRLLGKEQINIDSLIQMPNVDMWTEMGKMAGRFYGEGLQEAVKKALEGIDLSALNGQKKTHGWVKNLGEIDQALSRLKDKKGNISQTKAKKIQEGFSPKPRKQEEALYTQIEKLQKSYSDKDEWEVRYANLVEYIKLYESYREKFKNVPKELASIGKFTYKQVKSIEPQLQTSLQNIFNVAAGKQPIGLTEGGAVDVNVIPRVIETLDVYDVLGGKDKIEVPVEIKVENEKPTKTKIENKTKKNTPKAYQIYRGVQLPEDDEVDNKTRRELLSVNGGAEYWASDKKYARSYIDGYEDGSGILVGTITPKNALIVDADGYAFDQFDKMSEIIKQFPEIQQMFQKDKNGKIKNADEIQAYINQKAKEAGYDVVITKNVQDAMNPTDLEFADETTTTYAVLNDSILKISGFLKKIGDEAEKAVISDELSSVPDYYRLPEDSESDNINQTIQSYEELCDVVKRYNELVLKGKTEGQTLTDADREELDGLTNRIQATRDLIASGDIVNEINAFDRTLSALGTTTPEKLAHYLGIEIPEAAQKARDSIESSNDSNKTNSENIQTILNDANKFLSSNTDKKIEDYFELIATNAIEMSDDVKHAIEATIGSVDSLQSIGIGANNHGGLIGDKSALILKKPHWDKSNKKWAVDKQQSDDAVELQSRLRETDIPDVNLGKIQEVINAEEYLIELQSRVSGAPISTIGEAVEEINPEILNATESSIQSLISAMRKLYNIGVETDVQNLGNILYDGKNDQFGIVDMDVKHDFESFEAMLNAFAQTVRDQVEDIANTLNNPQMAEAWSRFADMVDGEVAKTVATQSPIVPVDTQGVEPIKDKQVSIDETALKSILGDITYKVQIVGDNESSEQGTTVISEESLKTILSSVTFNVQGSSEASTKSDNAGAPQAQATEKVDESSSQAPWARENTLSGEIKSTLEDIRKNTTLDENNKPETSLGEDTVTRLTDAISKINITSDLTTEGLATQDTVSEISGLVKSINDKIVQGTKVVEKGKSTAVGDSKNTQKHNSTINHGQAEGASGSAQKMFDYYYWLEEQMEKFKNNTKYYNALKSVRDRITPKIVKFNDELEASGKESPVWKKSLDQKHDLHMAQIQGGEEYYDSLSTEKKALELLKEEYRLKSEIFNLEQQGAIKEDLKPLHEKLGIYQSIRNVIEDGMDDSALTRYATQAAAVQGKGEDKLTVANIKSSIKARAEEAKKAVQSVKEEEQQEANALKELKKLYSELGVLQAKKQASDKGSAVATELRAQISAKKSEIAAKQVDHNVNQQLLEDERQLSYEKQKSSIAMQNAASKDATATKEEATTLKELKKLYETLGKQKAIMDAATPGAQYDKAKSDYDKTVADIRNIPKASNFEAEDEIDIYNKAYEEQKRVLENEKKIQDEKRKTNDTLKQTKQALEEIKKLYAELGKWQAILDTSDDNSYVAKDAQLNIDRLKEEIEAKKEKVNISEEELQQIYEIAKAEKQRAIASQQSKQADKDILKQQIKQSRENARFNRANSVWNTGVSTIESLWEIDDDSIDILQIPAVRQLIDALHAHKAIKDKIAQQGSIIDPNDEALLKAQTQDVAILTAQVKELIQNYKQLSGKNATEIGRLGAGDLKEQLIAAAKEFTHGKGVIGEFNAETETLAVTVQRGAHEFTTYTIAARNADQRIMALEGTTKRTETFFEASARKMKEISSYITGMGLISRGMQEIRQGITYVREIDSALTELKKVTDETEESYDRFLQTASKTAAKVGSTVRDVVSSTADFARLK
mgnify:CR=1 FL=1